jgi:hypothetical protein
VGGIAQQLAPKYQIDNGRVKPIDGCVVPGDPSTRDGTRPTVICAQYSLRVVLVPKVAAAEVNAVYVPCGSKQAVEVFKVYCSCSIGKASNSPLSSVGRNVDNPLTNAAPTPTEIFEPLS